MVGFFEVEEVVDSAYFGAVEAPVFKAVAPTTAPTTAPTSSAPEPLEIRPIPERRKKRMTLEEYKRKYMEVLEREAWSRTGIKAPPKRAWKK